MEAPNFDLVLGLAIRTGMMALPPPSHCIGGASYVN